MQDYGFVLYLRSCTYEGMIGGGNPDLCPPAAPGAGRPGMEGGALCDAGGGGGALLPPPVPRRAGPGLVGRFKLN